MVVGAGAAGLMAAVFAARQGCRVIVLESTDDGGRKILISGGGRCNVLPRVLQPERFVTDSSPALVRKLLRSWALERQRRFLEDDVGVPLKLETETGKYFPVSDRARDVRDGLVALARAAGTEFKFGSRLTGLEARAGRWYVATAKGPIAARAVVLATGGQSVPSTGSDGFGLTLAASLGHRIVAPYPALTPLVANPAVHAGLAGVSVVARIRARWRGRDTEATGGFLFTHRGYSGPAVLDVSHVAALSRQAGAERAVLRVRWSDLHASAWESALLSHGGLVQTAVARKVPARLAAWLLEDARVPAGRRAAELRKTERTSLIERLTSYELPWTGDEGYRKAEVTGGGVALDEVDLRTLESRRCPGLYLCGEILDAFGPIGGHNFAWAWATGRLAGISAAAARAST